MRSITSTASPRSSGDWWFNVRQSNTEPLLRLVLEARTRELMDQKKAELLQYLGTPE